MRWFLVIFLLLLAFFSLFGTFSDKETPADKKSYKNLAAIFAALAILAAVVVDRG